jgi:hypothetical protein
VVAEPNISLETITPVIAREMLKLNTNNRRVDPEEVNYLSGAMSRQEWVVNGETISFDTDEILVDGQHRLHAVVASGVSIETLVIRNLPTSARDVVGQERVRKLSEQLAVEGFERSVYLASAVNNLHRFTGEEIRKGRGIRPSTNQALERLGRSPELQESVALVSVIPREIGFGPVGVLATMHFLFRQVDPEPTDQFFTGLIDGEELARGDPVLLLRNRFLQEGMKARRDRLKPHNVAHLMIVAFNHRRAGNRLEKLRARWNDPFPEILPPGVIDRQRRTDHFRHQGTEAEARETHEDRMRAVFAESPGPIGPSDLAAKLDPPVPIATVNSWLWREANAGQIQKVGRGLYAPEGIDAKAPETIRERVRRVVARLRRPVRASDVLAELDPPIPLQAVQASLAEAAQKGLILRVSRGLYAAQGDAADAISSAASSGHDARAC